MIKQKAYVHHFWFFFGYLAPISAFGYNGFLANYLMVSED